MTKKTILLAGLFGVLLATVPGVVVAEDSTLRDASFEQQLPPDEGGWNLFEISLFSKNAARTGNQSMYNGGFSRTMPYPPHLIGNASGAYQQKPARPGSRWRLTGYGMTPTKLKGAPAFGALQLSFFDADGNDLGTVETAGEDTKALLSNEINVKTPVGEWQFLDTGMATAPEGTVTVQAFTAYVDYSGTEITQGVHFDDLELCSTDDDSADDCAGEPAP
jgi:hypothetical protein